MHKPRGAPTRRDRIILLLETLADVRDTETTDSNGSTHHPESRPLQFSHLYHAGSYAELERCMDTLRTIAPRIHWHIIRVHVEKPLRKRGQPPVTDQGRKLRDRKARLGVDWLEKHMPAFVMVPVDLLENAGYTVPRSQREKQAA